MTEGNKVKYCALILAAGNSTRFISNKNKLFHLIGNKTIFELSLEKFIFDDDCEYVVITYNSSFKNDFENIIIKYKWIKKIILVQGGNYRHESFVKGVKYCFQSRYVFIHDAARPFLTKKLIKRIKDEINQYNYDVIVPIIDINDSVLKINNNNILYLDRHEIKIVQTPQAFKISSIYNYVDLNNKDFSDELSWILSIKKINYKLIEGEKDNIKITFKNDLQV